MLYKKAVQKYTASVGVTFPGLKEKKRGLVIVNEYQELLLW